MKKISLTKGNVAFIDDEDTALIAGYSWVSSHGYATARIRGGGGKQIRMHRLILGAGKGQEVDHINGNPLDNRRQNLRFCTRSQNLYNKKRQKNNTSGFKGVCWDKNRNKWRMQITISNKHVMKRFKKLKDAVVAYKQFAEIYYGVFARTDNQFQL